MTTEPQQAAVAKREARPIAMGDKGLKLTTLEDAFRFAKYIVESGLAPKGMAKPEQVLIAMQVGAELGFTPMRSLAAVVVINGKPGLYGEAALALIHDRGVCSRPPVLSVEGEGDSRVGYCRFQRKDMPEPIETRFSVADAKIAKLWGKDGPWVTYAEDMLQWRAFARSSKRYFSDVTMGLVIAEELQDYPPDSSREHVTPPDGPDPLLTAQPTEMPELESQRVVVEAEVIDEPIRESRRSTEPNTDRRNVALRDQESRC